MRPISIAHCILVYILNLIQSYLVCMIFWYTCIHIKYRFFISYTTITFLFFYSNFLIHHVHHICFQRACFNTFSSGDCRFGWCMRTWHVWCCRNYSFGQVQVSWLHQVQNLKKALLGEDPDAEDGMKTCLVICVVGCRYCACLIYTVPCNCWCGWSWVILDVVSNTSKLVLVVKSWRQWCILFLS
jgi:hypothetical protein